MSIFALESFGNEFLLFGVAGLVSLVAFVTLILVPAVSSYGRIWEKVAAGFLSVFVLVTLVAVGIGLGLEIVLHYDKLVDLFHGS